MLFLTGFTKLTESGGMDKQNDIRAALDRLLARQNDDAFVIILDKKSGKFVQFAGGTAQGLQFDLPSQPLSCDETERATAVLAEYGIQMEEWNVYDRPGGESVGTQRGFQTVVGHDVERAVELAWRVLTDVYAFDHDFPMSIEEN